MENYVNANKLMGAVQMHDWGKDMTFHGMDELKALIGRQLVEDVAPVIHAHWYTYPDDKQFHCNNCKKGADLPTLYCPNCPAKMDEEMK